MYKILFAPCLIVLLVLLTSGDFSSTPLHRLQNTSSMRSMTRETHRKLNFRTPTTGVIHINLSSEGSHKQMR